MTNTIGTRLLIVLGKFARPVSLVAVIVVIIFASYIFTPSGSIFNKPLGEVTPHQLSIEALTGLMWIVAICVCIFLGVRTFYPPNDPNVLEKWGEWGVIAILIVVFITYEMSGI
jgi:uncharacterized membrane protein YphA (DoxX/SURF4 family)